MRICFRRFETPLTRLENLFSSAPCHEKLFRAFLEPSRNDERGSLFMRSKVPPLVSLEENCRCWKRFTHVKLENFVVGKLSALANFPGARETFGVTFLEDEGIRSRAASVNS